MKNTFRILGLFLSVFAGQTFAANIDLQVSAYTHTPDPIVNGGMVTFSLTIQQNTAATSAPSMLTITPPTNVTYQSNSSGCTYSAPNLTCPITSLAQSATTTVTYTATGNGAGAVSTQATIAADSGDSDVNSGNDQLVKTITSIKGADLTLTHTGPGGCTNGCTSTAGSNISFTITVVNNGPDSTSGFRVIDNLPSGIDFSYSSYTGSDWSCSVSGTTVTCDYTGAPVASSSNAQAIVINGQIITSAGSITNGASVLSTDSSIGDPDPTNNGPFLRAVSVTAGTNLQANSTLVSTATGLTTILSGDAATLTLSATNSGTQQAAGVTITDSVPGDFSIGTLPVGCTATGQDITCTVGTLNASTTSSSFVIPLTATAAGGTTGSNTANITRTTPVAGNNTPSSTNYSIATPFSRLTVTKSKQSLVDVSPVGGGDPVQAGQQILNTIVVTNQNSSTSDVTGTVTVVETLASYPDETFNAVTVGSTSAGWSCSVSTNTVTCNFTISGSLARGSSLPNLAFTTIAAGANMDLYNEVCTGGSISSHVPADDDTTPECSGTKGIYSASADTDIGITKTVDDNDIDVSETSFTYTITVENHSGTDTASTINIADAIPMYYNGPAGTTGITAILAGQGAGESCSGTSTVNCVIKNLAPGATRTITIQVTRPILDGTNITNTARWDSEDTIQTTNSFPDTATVDVTIAPIADVTITNIVDAPDPVKVGVVMTYTTSIKNKGPSTAAGVVLRHVFDTTRMAYQGTASLTGSGGSCSYVASFSGAPHAGLAGIECTGFSMTNNQSRQLTFNVLPTFSYWNTQTLPDTYSSDASITTTTTESDSSNNTDNNIANITSDQLDIAITKSEANGYDPDGAGPLSNLLYDPVAFADQIKYLVTIRNNGPSLATQVKMTDILTPPAGQTGQFISVTVAGGNFTPSNVSCSVTGGATPGTNASPEELTCYLSSGSGDIANSVLPSGKNVVLEMTFTTGGSTPVSSVTYSNSAAIESAETGTSPYSGDSLTGNNTITENTTVLPKTDLYITKAVDAGTDGDNSPYNINETFNYLLTLGNIGNSDAAGVQITDSLPTGFVATGNVTVTAGSGVSLSTNTCQGSIWAGSCDLGPLPLDVTGSDSTKQVVITIPVRTTTSYAGPINNNITNTTNIAPVAGTSIDTNASNNSGSVDVQINKSSIAGIVYEDNNNNGTQDSGETGINSVTLTISGTDKYGNTITGTATTNGTGAYLFDMLPPSDGSGYTVTETHPSAYVDGLESISGSVVSNSNSTDLISSITLPADTAITGYLFGELASSSSTAFLSGYVYNDGSNDGSRDPENPGIDNVTITLTGTDVLSAAVNLTATTNSSGYYSFPNLVPGIYVLTETQPTGYQDNIDTVGQISSSNMGTLGNDVISAITLIAGDVGTEYNFADSNTAIKGFVYVDANNDGIKDSSEAVISGVTVTLTGNDSGGNPINLTTTTDSNGAYDFSGMVASDTNGYTVTETQPTAWADGKDTVGDSGGTVGEDLISKILIGSSTFATGYNFGELGASLSGYVYNDNGDDGQKDPSDPGIPNVTITLTGTDLNGNPVSEIVTTVENGTYRFSDIPLPDSSGFTITETQPSGINDGKENTSNVISNVPITTPGVEETGLNFGEIIPSALTGSVSGKVHDRDDPNKTYAGWTVEILKNSLVIATTITDSNSDYLFKGLQPGAGYTIRFRHPESNAIFGVIENVTLTANTVLPDQNLPLDPSGVVYDSVTRQPIPGAIVTLSGPSGFNPTVDLIGGTTNLNQIVGADGLYKFLLNPSAPAGVYSLSVTEPAGYLPPNSVNIPAPCAGTLVVGPIPAPSAIQAQDTAPSGSASLHDPASCALGTNGTQYYLSFNLNSASADVINNHIPLDPAGTVTGLTVVKSTPKVNVSRSDLVPYSVRVTNNLTTPITNIQIRDQIPAGFKYVANSAILDGMRSEPQVNNRELTWPAQDYAVGESHQLKLLLVIGAGVGEGEYTNQAWGINGLTGVTATAIADATVRVIPDPTFDCSDLIGKVFDDQNTNGYQDEGEAGIPGIRVVTARGLVITTDSHGRYHVPCAAIPNEMHGSNFIIKLDEQSLPSGYRITTENPRVVRLTRGKLAKLNFGAAIHRVVRLDISAKVFDQDSHELKSNYAERMQKLITVLAKAPSILRVAYTAKGEDKKQVRQHLINFRNHLRSIWGDCDCNYELIIEEEVLWGSTMIPGSASTGRVK